MKRARNAHQLGQGGASAAAEMMMCIIVLSCGQAAHAQSPDSAVTRDANIERGEHVERGEHLLGHLNCTACHEPGNAARARIIFNEGPRLTGIADRMTLDEIESFIKHPAKVKPATRMPHVLRDKIDHETARSIAHFLASLPVKEKIAAPKGDIERGRSLYHFVGCVACHAPEKGHRPAGVDEAIELTAPSTPSEPIKLAQHYQRDGLAAFLRDPLSIRPSGRMPDMKLSSQEAADVAAYLQRNVPLKVTEDKKVDVSLVTVGLAAFIKHGCANCHETGQEMPKLTARSIAALRTDESRGCLSASPAAGLPMFTLSDADRDAMRLALADIKSAAPLSASQRVDRALTSLNCLACHDRDGKGGVDPALAIYFQSTTDALGDEGRIPPPLTNVGAKLTETWLRMILLGEGGSGEMRPHLRTRMPLFGKANVEHLVKDFAAADPVDAAVKIDVTSGLSHHRGFIGRSLMGNEGLNCITCHGLKGEKALGPPAMDLTRTTERLQPQWFKQMMLNPQAMRTRTIMPAFFADGKSPITAMISGRDADKQIEQMWIYLKEIDQSPLPPGMATQSFVLKPDKPMVFRTFLEGAGTQAIAVGFPQRIHAAFDAREVRWAVAWRGDFLDAEATWIDRYTPLTKPLSTDVHKMPAYAPLAILKSATDAWPKAVGKEAGYNFGGYQFDKSRMPTLRYTYHGAKVSDRLEPAPDGKSLRRTLVIENPPSGLYFRGMSGKVTPVLSRDGKATIEEVVQW